MLRILLFPYWIIQIFTKEKSFRKNPIIGSRILNRLGLHVARMVIAHGLYNWRMWLLSGLVDKEVRETFRRDGIIVFPDFLPAERFNALKDELRNREGEVWEERQGDSLVQRIFLSGQELDGLPATESVVHDSRMQTLLRYTSSKNRLPLYFIENIVSHTIDAESDPQRNLHTDTFHPSMKAWLYLDDVTPENGPFTYCKGCHRLTWKRLKWEYRRSLDWDTRLDGHFEDGSMRQTDADLEEMGYPQPTPMYAKANTLVIADPGAPHRRGQAQEVSTRMALFVFSRDNPFNPMVSPMPKLTHALWDQVKRRYYGIHFNRLKKRGATRDDRIFQGRFKHIPTDG